MSDTEVDRTIPEIVLGFVSTLRRLMTTLATRNPNDIIVVRAQKRLSLAADTVPVTIMEIAGPYLYQYRKDILNEDPAVWGRFFQPGAFEKDLAAAEDVTKRDAAEYLIPKIQEIVGGMAAEKQEEYIETVRNLLDDYMDWHLLMESSAR